MVLDPDGAGSELTGPVGTAALAGAVLASGLLVLAFVAELARRRRRARRVVEVADRLVPPWLRTLAASVLAVAATLAPARASAADGPVRSWLEGPSPATAPAVVTPGALDTLVPPSTVPAPTPGGPLVLVPEEAAPTTPPPPAPSPPPSPGDPPAAPSPPVPVWHVVVPGDCLWSIAARLLGPGADDRAVDLTWRAIYTLNRAAVGDDPGLIHPGLVLRLPPPSPQ